MQRTGSDRCRVTSSWADCQAQAVVTKPKRPSGLTMTLEEKRAVVQLHAKYLASGSSCEYRRIARACAKRDEQAGIHGGALVRHRGSHRVARLLTCFWRAWLWRVLHGTAICSSRVHRVSVRR
jgi:hypothetical protein